MEQRKVVFKKLILSNWRTWSREIDFNEDYTLIKGKNESGKSSIWDSLIWVLTGVDSKGRFNHRIFDERIEPTKENSVPASVELHLSIDGMDYKLKRTAEMGWVRPRGQEEYRKTNSDIYQYSIDGVEVSTAEYKKFIEERFAPIEKLKFILNIDYYQQIEDWRDLRKHFADIIGEVSKDDYVGDFTKAWELIDRYGSVDSAKDYLKAQRTPMRRAIGDTNIKGEKIVELETLQENLPNTNGVEEAKVRVEVINKEIFEIDGQITGRSESLAPLIQKRQKDLIDLEDMRGQLMVDKKKYQEEQSVKLNELLNQQRQIESQNMSIGAYNTKINQELLINQAKLETLNYEIAEYEKTHKYLTMRVEEVKGRTFSNVKCGYCGQELVGDVLEEAKERFEQAKLKEKNELVAKGKLNREKWNIALSQKSELEKSIEESPKPKEMLDDEEIKAKIIEERRNLIPYEETTEYKEKVSKIAQKEALITDIPKIDISDLEERKVKLNEYLQECYFTIGKEKTYNEQMEKINALKEDIKNTTEKLANIEGTMDMLDELERQKSEIIKTRVSKLFKICEVHMEERKKDGTTTPACTISMKDVSADVKNTASTILIGADISNGFAKYYGLSMPLIIDNRERVDEDKDFSEGNDRQIIELKRELCEFTVTSK